MTVLELPTPDPRTLDETSRPFAEAIAGQYAIKKLIGRGGMGIVYLARDRRLDRLVAIKTLPPHLANDELVRERFIRETRTAGAMSHPNIVPIHGADEIDGHAFFVMGFVDGESLAAHVRAQDRLAPPDVARILRDVAAALAHAHGRGIIHRDIKAENILIDRATGRALVTDFGIARLVEAAPLTATGQMLGTVYYVSPEQVAGDRVDARSDLYSLGVVGFFALTGRFPFDAELASAVLVAHVNRPAPPLRSIDPRLPASLSSIVDRCLAKDPKHRFASAADLLEAIETSIADIDRQPPLPHKPRLISDTEAQSIWQRAAELQASTGVQPRPLPIPLDRDDARDARRTSGFQLDDIRGAAREAGINTRYLEHALVERGLAPSELPIAAASGARSRWAGVPLDIVEHVEIDGEIQPGDFDRLLNILRDGTGQLGTVDSRARALRWQCEWTGHQLQASVTPGDGKTRVHLTQSVRGMAAGTMATSLLLGAGVIAPLAAIVARKIMMADPPRWMRSLGIRDLVHDVFDVTLILPREGIGQIAIWIGLVAALASIPIARAAIRWLRKQHVGRLRALAEAVSANVRLAARK